MSFNDGSGSEIKLSQIAGYYGGDHPLQLSNYYRGSAFVPSTSSAPVDLTATTVGGSEHLLTFYDQSTLEGRYLDFVFAGRSQVDVIVPWSRRWYNLGWGAVGGAQRLTGGSTSIHFANSHVEYDYSSASGGWAGAYGQAYDAGDYNPSQFAASLSLAAAWEIVSGSGVTVEFTGGTGAGGTQKGGIATSYSNFWENLPGYMDFSVPQWDGTGTAPTSFTHSGTIKFSGRTGRDVCKVRIGFGYRVSWFEHISYAPGAITSGYTRNHLAGEVLTQRNTSVPTSDAGEITLNSFNSVTSSHTTKTST